MNSRKAHQWFNTVYRNVKEYDRKDLFLQQGGLPHEFAFILVQSWITLDRCLEWKDGRHTIGQGLIDLAEQNQRHDEWVQTGFDIPMGELELNQYTKSWMDLSRSWEERLPYDWVTDREDRLRYGPFGPALAHFARPGGLEAIAKVLIDQKGGVDLTCFPEHLRAILRLLITSDDNDDDLGSPKPEEAGPWKEAFPVDPHLSSQEEEAKAAISRLEDEQATLAEEIEKLLAGGDGSAEAADGLGDAEARTFTHEAPPPSGVPETSVESTSVGELAEHSGADCTPRSTGRNERDGVSEPLERAAMNNAPEPMAQVRTNDAATPLEQVMLNDASDPSTQPSSSNAAEPLEQGGMEGTVVASSSAEATITDGADDQGEKPVELRHAAESTDPVTAPESNNEGGGLFDGLSEQDALEKAVNLCFEMIAGKNDAAAKSESDKTGSEHTTRGGIQSHESPTPADTTAPSSDPPCNMSEFAQYLSELFDRERGQGDGDCNMNDPEPVAQQTAPMTQRESTVQLTIDPRFIFQCASPGYTVTEDVEMDAPPLPEYDMAPVAEEPIVCMDLEQAPLYWHPAPQVTLPFPPQCGPEMVPIQEEEMVDAPPTTVSAVRSTALPIVITLLKQKNEAMKGVIATSPTSSNLPTVQRQVPLAIGKTDTTICGVQSGTPQIVISPASPVLSPDLTSSAPPVQTSTSSIANPVDSPTQEANKRQDKDAPASASAESSTVTNNGSADHLPDYVSDDDDDKENAVPSVPSKSSSAESESADHQEGYTGEGYIASASESTAASDDENEDSSRPPSPVHKPADMQTVLALLRDVETNSRQTSEGTTPS